MNNGFLRRAAIDMVANSSNIIKVAGILSGLKRWVLSMISPSTRREIALIDSKYSKVKGLILALQDNIAAVESAIQRVDMGAYDESISSLYRTIGELNKKLSEIQEGISDTAASGISSPKSEQRSTQTKYEKADPKVEAFFHRKTLRELNVPPRNITAQSESFYNSFASGRLEGGFGKAMEKLFHTKFNSSAEALREFVQKAMDADVFSKKVKPHFTDFTVIQVYERPARPPNQSKFGPYIGTIRLVGHPTFEIEGEKFEISYLGVFDMYSPNIPQTEEDAKYVRFIGFKQYVNEVSVLEETPKEDVPEKEPSKQPIHVVPNENLEKKPEAA